MRDDLEVIKGNFTLFSIVFASTSVLVLKEEEDFTVYLWIPGGRLWRSSWSIHRIQLPHGLGLVSVGLCQVL